jgi:hypothetical protein
MSLGTLNKKESREKGFASGKLFGYYLKHGGVGVVTLLYVFYVLAAIDLRQG